MHGVDGVERALARGDLESAAIVLLPLLDAAGDAVTAAAARVLRAMAAAAAAPDALAGAVDRLMAAVAAQEEQIAALRGLLEERL